MRYTTMQSCGGFMLYVGEPSYETSVGWFRTEQACRDAEAQHRRLSGGGETATLSTHERAEALALLDVFRALVETAPSVF